MRAPKMGTDFVMENQLSTSSQVYLNGAYVWKTIYHFECSHDSLPIGKFSN